jgi:hypothetical protein
MNSVVGHPLPGPLSRERGPESSSTRQAAMVRWIVQQGRVLRPLPGSGFSFARLTGGVVPIASGLDPRLASVTPAGVGARNGRWSAAGALLSGTSGATLTLSGPC